MKLKVLGIIVGALAALGLIGVGTIWAQGGTPTPTPNNPSAASACDQFNQALAQRLNVGVDKLTLAEKDASKDLIDQAVKSGKLTQDQANQAKQRIDQAQGNCGFGRPFDGIGDHHGFPPFGGQPPAGAPGRGLPNGPRNGQIISGTRSVAGATLTQVVADSPAAKAGLQVGDIILAVGGQTVDAQHLLDMLIRAHKPGDSLELKIQHGSDTKTVSLTLGAQPNNAALPYLGIQFEYRRSPT